MEAWAVCMMEGCTFPNAKSVDPAERRGAARGDAPSVCTRCGKINYPLRAYLAGQTRERNQRAKRRANNGPS